MGLIKEPSNRCVRVGLRCKIVVLILLVLLPLLSVVAAEIYAHFTSDLRHNLTASRDLADAVGSAFVNCLSALWNTELALGTAIAIRETNLPPETIDHILRQQAASNPTVNQFSWLAPDGTVISTTMPEKRGFSFARREHIQRIMTGEEKTVSDLIQGQFNDLIIGVARGIYRENRLTGIVTADVDVTKLGQVIPVSSPGNRNYGLIDRQGRSVYRRKEPNLPFEPRLLPPDSRGRLALNGEIVYLTNHPSSVGGRRVTGAAVPIAPIGWAAFATTPRSEVLAEVRGITTRNLVILSLITAGALSGALVLSNRLLRQIKNLGTAAKEISHGNLATRVELQGHDEVTVTAETFNRMAEKIQDFEATRTRFLHMAVHELRNPMTPVKGILALIRRKIEAGQPLDHLTQMIEVAEKEFGRLSFFLNEIMDSFRLQTGRLPLQAKPVDLREVIIAALEPFVYSDSANRFDVQLPEPDAVRIWGDSARLEHVLRNLFNNAVKYSSQESTVRVSAQTADGRAVISVSNSGPGIPLDHIGKIFDMYYQANSLSSQPGGLGLGLYICREIIELHQGQIRAESTEGEGATFYVELPLLLAEQEKMCDNAV